MSEEKTTKESEVAEKGNGTPAPSVDTPVADTGSGTPAGGESSSDGDEAVVEVPEKFKKIVEEIEVMSVLDLHELVKVFEKKFGVSAAAVAVAPAGAGEDSADEGGGLVTVKLEDAGASKIQVIKVVKEVLGLGLKEAKDVVDGAPQDIKEGIPAEEAEELKGKLEEAGAKVSVG